MAERVFLVDGSGYIFRAFYAVAPLTTSDGFPTNALFGFTRMLVKLVQDAGADHLCVVFDSGRQTFRTEMYSDYKANRRECPSELELQLPYFREIVQALGLPLFEFPGYEADDIIGTLATRLEAAGKPVTIVSGDKDLMQLVTDGTEVWDTMRDKHFGRKEVIEKFGVPPEQVVDLLALTGDTSDNVPGLPGVGPKTAVELLQRYSGVDGILCAADEIERTKQIRNSRKIAEVIRSEGDKLRLSKKLVTLDLQVPLKLTSDEKPLSELGGDELVEALLRNEPDRDRLLSLAERFEFASLVANLRGSVKREAGADHGYEYEVIYADSFDSWCAEFDKATSFAFDTETTSLDVKEAKLVGASIAWSDDRTFYIPFAHVNIPEGKQQVSSATFISRCGHKFAEPSVQKCAHNFKYDFGVMSEAGLDVSGEVFDTMIAAYLLSPDKRNYSLETLTRDHLKKGSTSFLELTEGSLDFAAVPVDAAAHYAGDDAMNCLQLRKRLEPMLDQNQLSDVFRQLEMPLVPVLSRMERKGIRLDTDFLAQMSERFEESICASREKLFAMAGCEFNVNSPKQLGEIMFGRLGISTRGIKKTKSGYSTDASVLENLAMKFEFPKELLNYRMLFKLKSTYIDALPQQVSALTGRLHSSFHQTGTATGRLSSSDPNLQNIPIQSREGRAIRQAFVAEEGHVLLSADYSQIELRILAHLSGDENFIQAFCSGQDIHTKTTREILGLDENDEVTPEMRRVGKTINFGIVYGMGGFRLSRELGIPLSEAQDYIDQYFRRYPGIKELFSQYEESAQQEGFVKTLYGRRRVISEIDASGRGRGFSARAAANAPIQGTAADLVKAAMVRLDARIQKEGLPLSLVLQIHDELVFECEESAAGEMLAVVRHEMENVADLRVPLRVEAGSGKNWDEAHS